MNIAGPFISRPVATSLLMAALMMVGLLASRELPIAALPTVDSPIIQVSTSLAGASPEVVAASITTPLESRLSQIPGLIAISSVSSFGSSSITLQFTMSRKIDACAQDVQAAISAAAGQLPRNLPNPPIYNKVNPADAPIVMLAVTSETMPLPQVNEFAETILGQKLAQVDGVGLVSMGGDQKRALRVKVNPRALANIGLSLDDVRAQIMQFNVNAPKGSIDGNFQAFSIGADDQLITADRYLELIIAHVDGSPVRLRDVARVEEGVENNRLSGWFNRTPAIIMSVNRQPGANVIATVDRIKALLPKLRASLPPTVKVELISDRTDSIRASVDGVRDALIHSVIIVIGVIFLFLRRVWATLIPSTALPLSLVGTFAFMYLAGYSIDNLSLMALTIAAGFVVDDAIVMVENIFRHMENGEPPAEAARKGARQIGFTVVSLTVSLVAVFVPLLFMEGVVGRLFREFAVTLSVAVIVSAFVSLTFTPMLCARFLRTLPPQPERRASFFGDLGFSRLQSGYVRALEWTMARRGLVHLSTLLAIAATIALFYWIPKGLLPVQDNGMIVAVMDAAEDISSSALRQRQQDASEIILRDRDVANVQGFTGVSLNNPTPNTAQLYIKLKERSARDSDVQAIMTRLKQALAPLVGVKVYMQPSQELTLDSRTSRTQFQVSLQDADADELARWTPPFLKALRHQKALRDVATDQQVAGQQIFLQIDRDRVALLGISIQSIDDALYNAFGQRSISTIYTQANQYHVILESDSTALDDRSLLDSVYVKSNANALVPLASLVTRSTVPSRLSIAHLGRFPLVTLSFNLAEGFALGDALRAVDSAGKEIALPGRVSVNFTGAAAEFQSSLQNQPFLILAAIVVVYIVLGILYESYIHPITILSTLPSAGLGALSALMLFGYELDLVSLIGIILLIGIVKKNAIMMIDFALDAERNRGRTPEAAIMEACKLRFRPIMMTTMAALLGALPLVFDTAVGFELRRPLGISIVGGMLVSQILTLFSTPAIYILFAEIGRRLSRGKSPAATHHPSPTHDVPALARDVAAE